MYLQLNHRDIDRVSGPSPVISKPRYPLCRRKSKRGKRHMIRMGRGNRDQPGQSDHQELTPAAEPSYRYANETQAATARGAISESDSMARDIKEGRLSGFVGHG